MGKRKRSTPALGYREGASGALGGVGNFGYSWSSATSGIHGLDLNFYSQYLSARFGDSRTPGFQLRCLSE